jgi:hypothetical protein
MYGCGTIFKITTAGKEKVLYSFTGDGDGYNPVDDLTNVNGTLYGVTSGGVGSGTMCHQFFGCGVIFSITTSGTYNMLYGFCQTSSCTDGFTPQAGLTYVNGTLYGTTTAGGASGLYGAGTVYSLSGF